MAVLDQILRLRIDEATYQRIERIAKRDQIPATHVLRELIGMAIDARENWQRMPKVQIAEESK